MIEFWGDTSVLIVAKNGPYAFDIVPGFWDMLDQKVTAGTFRSSLLVYQELEGGNDGLAQWVKARRNSGLFVQPDAGVQANLAIIASYVTTNCDPSQAAEFLRGADPWLVAHAMTHGGKVVTQEKLVPVTSKKVKIPNICRVFNVETVDMYQMLRAMKVSFSLVP